MGIQTGADYLEGLRDDREVWISGERVKDVTTHPELHRGAKTLAGFLDKQFDPDLQDRITYEENGERFAMSFLIPRSKADIQRRGAAFYAWATWSNGMFGRTPDYKNASVMAFAGAADFLAQGKPEFAHNMRRYYDEVRRGDKVLTHTLVNPQISYRLAQEGKFSPKVAFKWSRKRMPVSSSTTYDEGKSHFDAPLSSRFEEMDAVVIFDHVLVPWERVFMYRDPLLCNRAFAETNAVVHMMHQVACGKLAKAEFIVGLLCAMAQATGKDNDMAVKGQIAEAMWIAESIRAFLYSAEHKAHEDQWGMYIPERRPLDTSRNLFPNMYPRLIEIVQMMGSSSMMATPCEVDFNNAIADDVEQYFQVAHLASQDRVALFRLAQNVAVSGFGSRQSLYERFFFGPPNLLAAVYFDLYNKDEMIERVDALLKRDDASHGLRWL